jgi:hypothetical protein
MSEKTASPTSVTERRPTAAERQEELVRQLVKLTESVQTLATRTTEEEPPPPTATPVGATRVQFAYAMLGQFLGRPRNEGFNLPTVEVTRKAKDDNTGTLTFGALNGGDAARLLARDGTVDFLEGLVKDVPADTKIPNDMPIDIIVVITTQDGIPRAISLCLAFPGAVD